MMDKDPALPPVTPNGEPDWEKMVGRQHGHPLTEESVKEEAEALYALI